MDTMDFYVKTIFSHSSGAIAAKLSGWESPALGKRCSDEQLLNPFDYFGLSA